MLPHQQINCVVIFPMISNFLCILEDEHPVNVESMICNRVFHVVGASLVELDFAVVFVARDAVTHEISIGSTALETLRVERV